MLAQDEISDAVVTLNLNPASSGMPSVLDVGVKNDAYITGNWEAHDIAFTKDDAYTETFATLGLNQIVYAGEAFMWEPAPVVFGSKFRDAMVLGAAHPDEYYAFANAVMNEHEAFNCSVYGTEPGYC